MSKPFDWFAQELLEQALAPVGKSVTEKKVSSAAQFVDLTFVPNSRHAQHRAELGLLGRMTEQPCLLEPFHHAPSLNEVLECIRKQLTHHHSLKLSKKARANALPWSLWVIASGRPTQAISAFALKRRKGWPSGIYESPVPALPHHLVVVSELPTTKATLTLRLLGAGASFAAAAQQVAALPDDDPLRQLADPLLVQLRLKSEEGDTSEAEKEQIRMATLSVYERWERKVRAEGLVEGRVETARAALLEVLEARALGLSKAEKARVEDCSDPDQLALWLRKAATAGSTQEIFTGSPAKRRAAKPKSKSKLA